MMPQQQTAVARYLSKLPNGLSSYPDCMASVDIVNAVRARHPNLAAHPKLSPNIQALLAQPTTGKSFIPEVHCMVYFMALRDSLEPSDQAVIAGVIKDADSVLDSPLVRHFWRVLSPSLMILGCQKRWASIHQGSQLVSIEGGQSTSKLELRFPPHLFNDLMLKCFAAGMEQALRRTHVANCKVVAQGVEDAKCAFLGYWGAS